MSSVEQWKSMLRDGIGESAICLSEDYLPKLATRFFEYLPKIYLAQRDPDCRGRLSGRERPGGHREVAPEPQERTEGRRVREGTPPNEGPDVIEDVEDLRQEVDHAEDNRASPGGVANTRLVRVSVELDKDDHVFEFGPVRNSNSISRYR